MLLIGQNVLVAACMRNAPMRKWLAVWADTVERKLWLDLTDLRRDYPTADGVRLRSRIVVTVFNVKGNEYRLLTAVNFELGIVRILEVMTHAEYDRNRWKARY